MLTKRAFLFNEKALFVYSLPMTMKSQLYIPCDIFVFILSIIRGNTKMSQG